MLIQSPSIHLCVVEPSAPVHRNVGQRTDMPQRNSHRVLGSSADGQEEVDMKFLCKCFGTCALAAAMAAALAPAMAQTAATAVTTAASAPLAPKAGPRRMTPAESRDSATMPGDLRPEERVTPQLVIPLRKGAAQPKPATAAARRAAAPASAGIDDTAARCEAESSKQARQRCREAHAMPTRPR